MGGRKAVALHIHLNPSLTILQLRETGLTHDAFAHDAAGDAHDGAVLGCRRLAHIIAFLVLSYDGQVNEAADDVCAPRGDRVFRCGVRLNAHIAQRLHILTANNLLFAQLKYF